MEQWWMAYNVRPFLYLKENKMFLSVFHYFSFFSPPYIFLRAHITLHNKASSLTPSLMQNVLRCVCFSARVRYLAQHKHCLNTEPMTQSRMYMYNYTCTQTLMFIVLNPSSLLSSTKYVCLFPLLSIYLAYHSDGTKVLCKHCCMR